MEPSKTFQTAAVECGFVELNEAMEASVMWYRRTLPDLATTTHLRMCVDSVTNSATIYWMSAGGKVQSKTFRAATAMEEWLRPDGATSPDELLRLAKRVGP
jgi:hypothetical protein